MVANWLRIMTRTKQLTFLTASYSQASVVFPIVVVSPAYFAGAIQLGGLTQTASAFNSVQDALSFFINVYRTFAEWRAVIERLDGFEARDRAGAGDRHDDAGDRASARRARRQIALDELDVSLPNGKPLVAADGIAFAPRDQVLVTGPSGSGKSTLFRAIAGIWPFGTGTVSLPASAKLMILPQRPYLPIGTLAAAVSYPADRRHVRRPSASPSCSRPSACRRWPERLDEEAHWNRMLSLGEQQRIGIARALLQAPDYPVARRGDRLARRAGRGRALPLLQRAAAERHHRVDRASLDARGVPQAAADARARGRALSASKEAALNPAT